MNQIDEKFKDVPPQETVDKIWDILTQMEITLEERWHESGIEGCYSVTVSANGGFPASNGKGVTRDLALASAYAEFIERLQCGLFLYKFQSINRDPKMNLHTYAPDGVYMTMQELEENGEWMDYIIDTYGSDLTRNALARKCKMYACTEEDKILTIPFYSLFEDKYVYLPAGFVEQIYSANGCCAGNTREEAWVHALSEMMERKGEISMLVDGKAVPKIPYSVLERFPTVRKIFEQINASGKFDISLFDISLGNGFPVVATRIINRETQQYLVNTAADPVFEIAIHRTLTEMFQGRNLGTFSSRHGGKVLNDINDMPLTHNVMNQLETGNGQYVLDFFTEEVSCERAYTVFDDNSDKNNRQLLAMLIELYKALNKPVYIRNYSFLGFHCYKFVVPGFSESRGLWLTEKNPEYLLADDAAKTLRNPAAADNAALAAMLLYCKKIDDMTGRRFFIDRLSGIPMVGKDKWLIMAATLGYANYRLKQHGQVIQCINMIAKNETVSADIRKTLSCFGRYLELKKQGKSEEKIKIFLYKFYEKEYADNVYDYLGKNQTPFDEFLLKCDGNCVQCSMRNQCGYEKMQKIIADAGKHYSAFRDGQDREVFQV